MEIIKKYQKSFQWLFLLIVFFGLCFGIDVPEGYKYKGENRNTSGWNTVVVAGKIIEKIGPILAIKNLQAFNNF